MPYQAKKGRKQLPCRLNGKMLTVFFLITKVSFNTILLGIDVAALILSTKKESKRIRNTVNDAVSYRFTVVNNEIIHCAFHKLSSVLFFLTYLLVSVVFVF